jgi:hypothetical protein
MDDAKTKTKRELVFLIILTILFFLYLFTISDLSNIIHSQFLNNIFISILVGFLGIFAYYTIMNTLNTKELIYAFLLNILASFLFFSMLNNPLLKLFGSLYTAYILIPLILGIIFDSITNDVRKRIIYYMVLFSIIGFIFLP